MDMFSYEVGVDSVVDCIFRDFHIISWHFFEVFRSKGNKWLAHNKSSVSCRRCSKWNSEPNSKAKCLKYRPNLRENLLKNTLYTIELRHKPHEGHLVYHRTLIAQQKTVAVLFSKYSLSELAHCVFSPMTVQTKSDICNHHLTICNKLAVDIVYHN